MYASLAITDNYFTINFYRFINHIFFTKTSIQLNRGYLSPSNRNLHSDTLGVAGMPPVSYANAGAGVSNDSFQREITESTMVKHKHSSSPEPMYAPRCATPATLNDSSVNGPPLFPGLMLPAFSTVKLFMPLFGIVRFRTRSPKIFGNFPF